MRADDIVTACDDARVGELLDFWEEMRGGHAFPAQSDLDLVRIPKLLPHLFIIDIEGERTFRYRFMGSAIDAHVGSSLTGKTFIDFRKGRILSEITDFFERISEGRELGLLTTQLPSESRHWAVYRRCGLPVADDHETPNKIVGLMLVDHNSPVSEDPPSIIAVDRDERGHADQKFGIL